MKAMILAAGRGERMRPLTDTIPKPLIKLGEQSLIERHCERLGACGFKEIVINVSYLGDQIQNKLGDGQHYGVKIQYSVEEEALETGGGIMKAMPFLGNGPFIIVNGDIWTDYSFDQLHCPEGDLARIVLVDNPPHLSGDFALEDGYLVRETKRIYTHAGMTCYHPDFFAGQTLKRFSVVPLLMDAVAQKKISGEYFSGTWLEIGSLESLAAAQNWYAEHHREGPESRYGLDG